MWRCNFSGDIVHKIFNIVVWKMQGFFNGCGRWRSKRAIFGILVIFIILLWIFSAYPSPDTPPDNQWGVNLKLSKGQKEWRDSRGMRVVVGHYIGPDPDNVTLELMNENNFNPIVGVGNDGRPVEMAPRDLPKMRQLFQIHRFNLLASDRIPLNRTLPDVRRQSCKTKVYPTDTLPRVSVIIVFHNEAFSTLLRTAWSVALRSPAPLLAEIILVDDASDRAYLGAQLEEAVKLFPVPCRVLRMPSRTGLVGARLAGAKAAVAPALLFLDAHCEAAPGFLEPLLGRLAESPNSAVCPVIDIINDETLAYIKSFELHWGAFNWNLHFRWYTLGNNELQKRKSDLTAAFPSPAMAGGLFAIMKDYFYEVGAYDEHMTIWGGENLEMSFRLWQCGGKVEIAPCSHIGHIFRKSSPYSFPGGMKEILSTNLARVALVWMDSWADFFFKFNPEVATQAGTQNITERLELKKRLKCKGFEWYLDNVWPQNFFPKNNRFFGRIKHIATKKCIMRPVSKGVMGQPLGPATIGECVKDDNLNGFFVITEEGFMMMDESICLDAPQEGEFAGEGKGVVRVMGCSGYPRQKWQYDKSQNKLKHVPSGQCLQPDAVLPADNIIRLHLVKCTASPNQRWILDSVPWK